MKVKVNLSDKVKKELKGAQGDVGPRGEIGPIGLRGETGLDGKIGEIGPKGDNGSPDKPEQVRDKLETLKKNERLDVTAIKGLDDLTETLDDIESAIKKLKKKKEDITILAGGGLSQTVADSRYLPFAGGTLTGNLAWSTAVEGTGNSFISLPTTVGVGALKNYVAKLGGGSGFSETAGSTVTFKFDDIGALSAGHNDLIFNLGASSYVGPNSFQVTTTPYLGTAQTYNFGMTAGSMVFGATVSTSFGATDFIIQNSTGSGVGGTRIMELKSLGGPVQLTPATTKHVLTNGALGYLVTAPTGATVTVGDFVVYLCNATSNAQTCNLPAVASSTHRVYTFVKTDSSANTVTIDGNASETINGATTKVLSAQYDTVTIVCSGSAWFII